MWSESACDADLKHHPDELNLDPRLIEERVILRPHRTGLSVQASAIGGRVCVDSPEELLQLQER